MPYDTLAVVSRLGTAIARSNGAMRERYPRSGFGFALTLLAFIAATILILTNIVDKFPRP